MRLLAAIVAAALVAGCTPSAETPSPSAAKSEKVVVFAAASLNKVFPEIVKDSGTDVSFSFDGSSGLVDQLKGGAPADVFASANKANMDKAVQAGLIEGEPTLFATNSLVLITPADNPGKITGLDKSLDGKKFVICAPEVPCGAATHKVAKALGVTLKPVSEESKVTDVLGKVSSGDADAGIVYGTDAKQAKDKVKTIEIPGASKSPNTYWIAVVKNAKNPKGARDFIDQITGKGKTVLEEFGFGVKG